MTTLERDRLFALLTLVVAVATGTVAFGYAADSSWFPRVLSVFLGLMAGALLIRSLRKTGTDTTASLELRAAAIVFGACIAYALAIRFVSFEIVNYLFLVTTMILLGQRNPVVLFAVATGTMLLVKLLFFVMLDVSRPQGVWF